VVCRPRVPAREALLPLVVASTQLGSVALAPLFGEEVTSGRLVAGACLGLAGAGSLLWRRAAPVAVLAVVAAVTVIARVTLPFSAAPPLLVADLVALYSLAAERSQRTAVLGGVVVFAVETPGLREPAVSDVVLDALLELIICALVVALGRPAWVRRAPGRHGGAAGER